MNTGYHISVSGNSQNYYRFVPMRSSSALAIIPLNPVHAIFTQPFLLHLANVSVHLARLRGHLVNVSVHLARLRGHLANVSVHLAELRGHLANVSVHLAELRGHLANVSVHLARLRGHLANVSMHLARLSGHLANVGVHLAGLSGHLMNVNDHLSVSAPLDKFGQNAFLCTYISADRAKSPVGVRNMSQTLHY